VLLFAGTRDHAVPFSETKNIHAALPNSDLATFDAYHCLAEIPCKYGKGFGQAFLLETPLDEELLTQCKGEIVKKP
jgi:hypothetical protein